MIENLLKETLRRYPSIEKNALRLLGCVPSSIRLGNDFWRWYSFFEESEQWSSDQLNVYQTDCLGKLLDELSQTSTFYRKQLSGMDPQRPVTVKEFQTKVRTLSRDEFKTNYPDILSSTAGKRRKVEARTSGTTGMALQFYHPSEDRMRESAAIHHQWKRVGYVPGRSRRAEFRGLTTSGKIVETYPHLHMIRCSILNLKREHLCHYADSIRKYKVNFYHGYPSVFYLMTKEICNSGIDFPQPEALLLASETVYDFQLVQIRTAFPKAKIFAHYGCAEHTVMAGWCEYRQEYHVLPQYSLVEVDEETSEVIGTNFFNSINGFVRYRMTDTVLEFDKEPCPSCGRPYAPRFIRLGGRLEEYLFSPKNGWIPPAIVTYPLKELKTVREIQFVQTERKTITVNYTARANTDISVATELSHLEADLRFLFGEDMIFHFERVDDFSRSPAGKFKWIICELENRIQEYQ